MRGTLHNAHSVTAVIKSHAKLLGALSQGVSVRLCLRCNLYVLCFSAFRAQNGADTVSRSCARSWTQTVRLLTSHTESLVCVDCRHPSAVTLETRKAFGGDFAARELQQKHGASRHPNQLRKFARLCTHRSVAISHYHSHRRALASPAVASIWFCLPSAHHTSRAQCVMARSRAKSRQLVQVDGTLIKVDGSWLSDPPIRLEIRHELVEFWMICGDRRHQHLPWLGLNARCRGPPAMIDGSANTATQTSYGSLPGFAHIAPWRYRTIIRIVVRWLAQPSLPFGLCLPSAYPPFTLITRRGLNV